MTTTSPSPSPVEPTAGLDTYVFSDPAEGEGHHGELVSHLATVLDPFTTRMLTPLVDKSSTCLEFGAGAGTIATWLAQNTAAVTATDTDPRHIPTHPRLSVRRHNIATDPVEAGSYDLAHGRLVLAHEPARERILADKLVPALKPGGHLVIDEFADRGWDQCVLDAPDLVEAQHLFDIYHRALVEVMRVRGTDVGWGRRVHQVMRQAGLVEVRAEFGGGLTWHGGQAGCLLPHAMTTQIRPQLIAAGMTDADIDAFRGLLRDDRLVIHNTIAVSTIGRRPQ